MCVCGEGEGEGVMASDSKLTTPVVKILLFVLPIYIIPMRVYCSCRYNCLKTWLSISLLTTVEKDTRTRMLSQWIQIAECLRSNMGNMFGFAAIMDGVGSKQVMSGLLVNV